MGIFDLTGRVAIVTGSSRGIGRAIAEEMARLGAKVVISSRKAPACEGVAGAIRDAGGTALAIPCHIGEKPQLEDLVAKTREAFGPADILVCNAAVNPFYGPLAEIPDDAFDRIIALNVRSNLWLANLVRPEMAAKRDGAIVMIASIGGLKASRGLGAYGISKAADMQLVRSLAAEWGPEGIRVNAVAPGLVKTDFARALWEDETRAKDRIAGTPLRRLGEPIDIAGAAILLASPAGRFITGETIVVDGGVMVA